ncbi:MAG: hypothetical protein K8R88_15195 [Armatimonadetes bacterium]|nr:hypothetical protein [Armatimonadota bacterium]
MKRITILILLAMSLIGCGGETGGVPTFVGESRIEKGTYLNIDPQTVNVFDATWDDGFWKFSTGYGGFSSSASWLWVPAPAKELSGEADLPALDATSPFGSNVAQLEFSQSDYATHGGLVGRTETSYRSGRLKWTYHVPGYIEYEITNATFRTATGVFDPVINLTPAPLVRDFVVTSFPVGQQYISEATIRVTSSGETCKFKVGTYDVGLNSGDGTFNNESQLILGLWHSQEPDRTGATSLNLNWTVPALTNLSPHEYTAEAGQTLPFANVRSVTTDGITYLCTRGKIVYDGPTKREFSGLRFVSVSDPFNYFEMSGTVIIGNKNITINEPPPKIGL